MDEITGVMLTVMVLCAIVPGMNKKHPKFQTTKQLIRSARKVIADAAEPMSQEFDELVLQEAEVLGNGSATDDDSADSAASPKLAPSMD